MVRVVLNGYEVPPKDIFGEDGISTTITVEGGEFGDWLKKAVSGELTFYGKAYEIIRDEILYAPGGRLKELELLVFDTCTNPHFLAFKGVVRGDLISWCEGQCYARTTAVESTEDSKAMDCIKSTLVYDDHNGFQSQVHPRMVYCDEIRPEWLHHVVLSLGVFAMLVLDVLTPVALVVASLVYTVNQIINAINDLIPGDGPIGNIDFDGQAGTDTFQEWLNMRSRIQDVLIGCGRVHPSPLVREYITNVCDKCGLQFESTILNNPSSEYYNTVWWSAPVEKGTRDDGTTYIYANRPIETGYSMLRKLRPVFSGAARIKNGVLYFEREDRLNTGATWVDPQQLKSDGRLVGDVCFEFGDENPAAFSEIGFSEDSMDGPGNEARDLYKDIAEWNVPFNPVQSKPYELFFEFGMLRCRRDGVNSDVLDVYQFYPSLNGPIDTHGHVMMVTRGVAALPKLLVWNGNHSFGEVQRGYDRPGYVKPADENYNFPYHVNEYGTVPNTGYPPDHPNVSLYARFHAYKNPKVFSTRGVKWKFTFEYNADELVNMDPYAIIPIQLGPMMLQGKVMSVTVNHSKGTILVAGKA